MEMAKRKLKSKLITLVVMVVLIAAGIIASMFLEKQNSIEGFFYQNESNNMYILTEENGIIFVNTNPEIGKDVTIGDEVVAYIDGGIMETYPATANVTKIKVIKNNKPEDIPNNFIKSMKELNIIK